MNEEAMKATVVLETSSTTSKFPLQSRFRTVGSHQVLWFYGSGFYCGCTSPCGTAAATPGSPPDPPCGALIGAVVSVDGERRKDAAIWANDTDVHHSFTPAVAVLQLDPGEHLVTIDLFPNTNADLSDVFRVVLLDYGSRRPCDNNLAPL
jgi:hypothetical protein